jgi:dTDP-6-deoxy-L-talose 4-dehydrogenase (NAD+)
MRILVTGGSGFLGSAVVRHALTAGHDVAILSRQPNTAAGTPGSVPIPGDLASPPWEAIAGFRPEAVLHAAWIATPGVYLESPANSDWLRWSRGFAQRLPELGVRHLTVLGTCIEYAVTGKPLNEVETPLAPVSPYARAKAELHAALVSDLSGSGTDLAWARIFYPYGPNEHPARLASSLLTRVLAGQPITLKTPNSTKDYIHEDDVARALLTVVGAGFQGPINIGTGEGVTVGMLARTLAEFAGRPDLVVLPADAPRDPLDFVVADASRLHSLGWRPQVALVDGLRRLVEARRA